MHIRKRVVLQRCDWKSMKNEGQEQRHILPLKMRFLALDKVIGKCEGDDEVLIKTN
jgi:hypothetical protein